MKSKEIKILADNVLRDETTRLAKIPYNEISDWPDFPKDPGIVLNIPSELNKYHYGAIKNTESDGTITVVIQRNRSYFLGFGERTADGFYIRPNGNIERFTQKDIYNVT